MNIRHLHYFIAVAEELHFGNAAKRLKISQPPLSKQIAQLENDVGAELLTRTKRSVELTSAGGYFLEQAYQIIEKLEDTKNDTLNIYEGNTGILKIGFSGLLNSYMLKPIRQFRTTYPMVHFSLHNLYTAQQINALLKREIHVGFVFSTSSRTDNSIIDPDKFNIYTVKDANLLLAMYENHRFSQRESDIQLSDLKNEPLIMTNRSITPAYHDWLISICINSGFTPNITQKVDGVSNILKLVNLEIGMSLLSEFAFDYLHIDDNIIFKNIQDTLENVRLSVIWRKNETSQTTKNFISIVKGDSEVE